MDGGRVPAEPLGDPADRPAGFPEAEEGASWVEVELAVRPGPGRFPGANPRKGWGFALRDRTHPDQERKLCSARYGKRHRCRHGRIALARPYGYHWTISERARSRSALADTRRAGLANASFARATLSASAACMSA